jgi:hypothetical protein
MRSWGGGDRPGIGDWTKLRRYRGHACEKNNNLAVLSNDSCRWLYLEGFNLGRVAFVILALVRIILG